MMLCLFLFAPMPRGAFTGFQMIFLFSLFFLLPEAESECRVRQPAPWMKQAAAHSRTNQEECLLPLGWTSSVGLETSILPLAGFALFTLPVMSFSFGGFLFLRIFSWSFFLPNLPLFSFTSIFAPFSEPHQAVISVLGAKVIPGFDGKARSSLLFSEKISSPAGSIFPEKPCIP